MTIDVNVSRITDNLLNYRLNYRLDNDTIAMIPGIIISIGVVIYSNLL